MVPLAGRDFRGLGVLALSFAVTEGTKNGDLAGLLEDEAGDFERGGPSLDGTSKMAGSFSRPSRLELIFSSRATTGT